MPSRATAVYLELSVLYFPFSCTDPNIIAVPLNKLTCSARNVRKSGANQSTISLRARAHSGQVRGELGHRREQSACLCDDASCEPRIAYEL
jgi:hypothetical protein